MSQIMIRILIPILTILLIAPSVEGQNFEKYKRKLEKYRSENFPPERSYSRVSLGYALQKVFKKHVEYCGFGGGKDNRRDYVPGDISKFLGRRTMRTKVETADIRGGGLMYYIFGDAEMLRSFDQINYSTSRIFNLQSIDNQFVVNPDENFDSFILTKTCGGYLQAALEAGIEPPYAAFKAAFETDSKRQSSVFAISGSFVSPLKMILEANDYTTIEFMTKLWNFYQANPEFDGHAFYLQEFEGVMIKHISSAEENRNLERSVGLNFSGPFGIRLKSDLGMASTGALSFGGTDWETIIYTDFEGEYEKEELFAPLPTSSDIAAYFERIRPIYQKSSDFPLMTEGFDHTHFIVVEGMPENMTTNYWVIENVQPGVYQGEPRLDANYFYNEDDGTWGCRFIVTGRPNPSNFIGPLSNRPSRLNLSYTIRSLEPVNGEYLRFYIQDEIQTSSHPIASITEGEFDLVKKESRRFAYQWKFGIEIEDHYNPVSFDAEPYISNLSVRKSGSDLDVRISKIEMDRQRRYLYLILETLDSYPLERIDDSNMQNYNMSFDIHLPSQRGGSISVRPVKGNVLFPALRPIIIEPIASPAIHDLKSQGQGKK